MGERDAIVFGGQRQKIASERALIKNPAILILDKVNSALDIESERQFQQNLTEINQACTTFIMRLYPCFRPRYPS